MHRWKYFCKAQFEIMFTYSTAFLLTFSTSSFSMLVVYIDFLQYNTRYAISQNFYKSRVRSNTGKQTISYMASVFWHNIPSYLKNLNVYLFCKQITLYLFSEHIRNSMKWLTFWTFNSFEIPLLIWFGLSPCVCTWLFVSFNPLILFCFARKRQENNSKTSFWLNLKHIYFLKSYYDQKIHLSFSFRF